ncbi:DoxX family protein [Pedobacter sp. HMWF019]|uniref:DoxX family protein n=1 Tax=Pedobacter sp. HMWF019 TaxID=2056856 RepID=UPI000D3D5F38|nr:DoxX family protein [Pedobacter sp. HMWF019]PTS93462.1 DoxX family protein [Pedobacter sp. HMWF019]
MKPKSIKIIYWVTTGLLALFILPGIFFLNSPMAQEGTKHLGFPHWFSMEVGIGSFIGGLILIIPGLPSRLKEWNYVALGIMYVSALIAHLSVDGLIGESFVPLVPFALLLISYIYYHKLYPSG